MSCDVYRPAAIEQLKTLAGQVGVDFFPRSANEAPVAIAHAALDWARRHYHDVVLVDTAGRLAIDDAMMQEIAQLHAAVSPVETLFVVDAMQGQDAVNTARAFGETLPLTGIVLTKLDGDARGGAALSVRQVTGAPIKFVGVGEKLAGLEVFHPDRMASRILGMGDVLTLIEDAHRQVDEQAARKLGEEGQIRQGLRPRGFQGADRPDAKDGRDGEPSRQAAGRACPRRARQSGRRARDPQAGGHHRFDDAGGTGEARAPQGVAKATHRRRARACRCRRSTAF